MFGRCCSHGIASRQSISECPLIVNRKILLLYVVKQVATLNCYCDLMLMHFCFSAAANQRACAALMCIYGELESITMKRVDEEIRLYDEEAGRNQRPLYA